MRSEYPLRLSEIAALPQIVEITYCVCGGADDIHCELKTLPIPSVDVFKDLFSSSKREDKFETKDYKELYQDHALAFNSLEIVANNGLDIERLLLKKRKPNKKQREVKRRRIENQKQD